MDLSSPMRTGMRLAAPKAAEGVASFAGVSDERTEEGKLALIEACINAFGHRRSKDQVVRINFKVDSEALTIQISDSGHGFDVDQAREKVVGFQQRPSGIPSIEQRSKCERADDPPDQPIQAAHAYGGGDAHVEIPRHTAEACHNHDGKQ